MTDVDLPEDTRLGRQENNKRTTLWGMMEHTRANAESVEKFSHKDQFLTLSNALLIEAIDLIQRGVTTPAAILEEYDAPHAEALYRYIVIYSQ